jgi:NAD(P)-dependent dehydrogenase (short-subunit alcohol dehydrogenase family)
MPVQADKEAAASLTWLITGASRGLGRMIAETALERGHRVVLTARRPEAVAPLADLYPDRAIAVRLDVTDASQIAGAIATGESLSGGIDVLVNNAGFGFIGAIEEAKPAEYRALFDANVFGVIEMIRAVLPGMRRRGSGQIVNISSSGGIAASPGFGYYCSSKFAIEGLSEALAGEVAPFGIGVTIVEPGSFRTDFRAAASMQCTERVLDVYEPISGKARVALAESHGEQAGDPRKAAAAIVAMAERGDGPLRYPLGRDSLQRFDKKIAMLQGTRDAHREAAIATDF